MQLVTTVEQMQLKHLTTYVH